MKEVQALSKQIEEQAQTEVQHMKSTFIDVVNQCKKTVEKTYENWNSRTQ
jgi:hypothetical protein